MYDWFDIIKPHLLRPCARSVVRIILPNVWNPRRRLRLHMLTTPIIPISDCSQTDTPTSRLPCYVRCKGFDRWPLRSLYAQLILLQADVHPVSTIYHPGHYKIDQDSIVKVFTPISSSVAFFIVLSQGARLKTSSMSATASTTGSQLDQFVALNNCKQHVPYLRNYRAEYDVERDPDSPDQDQKWRARCYFKTPAPHFSTIMERCAWKPSINDAKREAARLMIIEINATTFSEET